MKCDTCGNDKWYYNPPNEYLTCTYCKHEQSLEQEENININDYDNGDFYKDS